jgi:hypothetical protein
LKKVGTDALPGGGALNHFAHDEEVGQDGGKAAARLVVDSIPTLPGGSLGLSSHPARWGPGWKISPGGNRRWHAIGADAANAFEMVLGDERCANATVVIAKDFHAPHRKGKCLHLTYDAAMPMIKGRKFDKTVCPRLTGEQVSKIEAVLVLVPGASASDVVRGCLDLSFGLNPAKISVRDAILEVFAEETREC